MKKRVAIIGAGVSGLAAIKCCLDEELEPVCFERSADIGGLWNYEEGLKLPNKTSVTRFTIANTSKEMTCFSDLPFPKDFPLFPPYNKILDYLLLYTEKFDLRRHINFNCEVIKVKQTSDFSSSGNWVVQWKDLKSEDSKEEIFNAVLLCSGRYNEIKMPKFEGQDEFQGQILHSRDFKSHEGFEGKRILVVGLKNTGGDIASELGGLGGQVYASSRKGVWIGSRLIKGGTPGDCVFNVRALFAFFNYLPVKMASNMMRKGFNERFDMVKFGIEPSFNPGFATGPVAINDILPERIISGQVIVKPNVARFTKTGVVFQDGTTVENLDAVIFATGYTITLPYLECDSFKAENDNIDLFKFMFPADIYPSTIALIGCLGGTSAIMPLSEMQCRLAARVIKGDVKLPSKASMRRSILKHRAQVDRERDILKFPDRNMNYMFEPYLLYMSHLSELCGCRPSFLKLLWMDRRLAWQYLFGPAVPAQFRLCGHGAWAGAKDTVLSTNHRAAFPYPRLFTSDQNGKSAEKSVLRKFVFVTGFSLLAYYFWPKFRSEGFYSNWFVKLGLLTSSYLK